MHGRRLLQGAPTCFAVDLERPALFALLSNCNASMPDQPGYECPCRETAHRQLQQVRSS